MSLSKEQIPYVVAGVAATVAVGLSVYAYMG